MVADHLLERGVRVVYMTANAKRIPTDFGGAIGIIAKPYTSSSVVAALDYLHIGVRNPPPLSALSSGIAPIPLPSSSDGPCTNAPRPNVTL